MLNQLYNITVTTTTTTTTTGTDTYVEDESDAVEDTFWIVSGFRYPRDERSGIVNVRIEIVQILKIPL